MLAQQESKIPGSLRTEIGTNIQKHKTVQLGWASGKNKISASCLLLTIRNAKWCFDVQSTGKDLGQTGMLPGKSIFATWLRQGPRPRPEFQYGIQAKRSTGPSFSHLFLQLLPQQWEWRLHSCATSMLTLSTGSSTLQGEVHRADDELRALTLALKGNTCKNQGQSLLNYQPKWRFQVFESKT